MLKLLNTSEKAVFAQDDDTTLYKSPIGPARALAMALQHGYSTFVYPTKKAVAVVLPTHTLTFMRAFGRNCFTRTEPTPEPDVTITILEGPES